MCNATAQAAQAILDALSEAIKSGRIFSAFDITTDARNSTDEIIVHADSREIVHNEFAIGELPDNYNQGNAVLDVPGRPTVIVYYPDGKTPEDHPKAVQTGGATSASANVVIPPIGRIPAAIVAQKTGSPKTKQGGKTKDGDAFICKVTCDGRVNVPKELYSQVSADGGTFDVQFNGSVLYKKPIGSEDRLVLKKSDLKGGSKFRVGVDVPANTITVEQI